jgi:hypothetical protein
LQEIPARKIPIKRGFSKFYRTESKTKRLSKTDRADTESEMDTFRVRKRENSFDHNKVPSFVMNKKFQTVRIKRKKTLTFMNKIEMQNFEHGNVA